MRRPDRPTIAGDRFQSAPTSIHSRGFSDWGRPNLTSRTPLDGCAGGACTLRWVKVRLSPNSSRIRRRWLRAPWGNLAPRRGRLDRQARAYAGIVAAGVLHHGRRRQRRRRQLILEAPRVDRAGHDAAHLVVHADLPGQIPSSASGRPEGLTTIPVFVVSAVAAPPQASQALDVVRPAVEQVTVFQLI